MTTENYQSNVLKAFPDFDNLELFADVLLELAPLGFSDSSWKNNTCPSMSKPIGDDFLNVFVDYNDQRKREFPEIINTFFVTHNESQQFRDAATKIELLEIVREILEAVQ